MKILELKDVTYRPPALKFLSSSTADKNILEKISFSVSKGEVIGIAGLSGSGKTTLARIISGEIMPATGSINFAFNDFNRHSVQILYQNNGELINPYRTVRDILIEAIKINSNAASDYETSLHRLLDLVNIDSELLCRKGYSLSGGEQQRVALARILAVEPSIIILDEPFSAQDKKSFVIIAELITKLRNEKDVTFIIISHILSILKNIADKLLIMHNGNIVEFGKAADILTNPKGIHLKFLLKNENYDMRFEEFKKFLSEMNN